jgi:phosphatidylserine/phosphatidylglycerophosphate/cardiolipin synthase-like enzyme
VADSERAYIGSVNLTTNSMDKNRELGILLDDASIVSQLNQINKADWAKAEAFPTGTLPGPSRTLTRLPVSFDMGL